MALNHLMHERNPFKTKKPDFCILAEKYEAFRQQTTKDIKGRVHVDFKNPACLKALTWALLKDEYDVDVEIPTDRLIPTIPLRINYILWLEDIFAGRLSLRGIDVGTGAVCVYPIIGARKNSWSFLATESDATNFEYARRNVQQNGLPDKIQVIKVSENCSLLDVLQDSKETYDFCMCNPPFYGSNLEAWGVLNTRSSDRPEPNSVNTASPMECIAPGGEVEFVREVMINSSLSLQDRIRVYTSMLGKKSSLAKVKEILRENNISNFGSTEFSQGNTMRWGIAWSFDKTVHFPLSASKLIKSEKSRPPLVLALPTCIDGQNKSCTLSDAAMKVKKILMDLKVSLTEANADTDTDPPLGDRSWVVTSFVNTWSHQRRERRRLAREHSNNPNQAAEDCKNDKIDQTASCRKRLSEKDGEPSAKYLKLDNQCSNQENDLEDKCNQVLKMETPLHSSSFAASNDPLHAEESEQTDDNNHLPNLAVESFLHKVCTKVFDENSKNVTSNESLPLLKCKVTVCSTDSGLAVHFEWIDGQSREYMHQLMQFLKNKL